MKELSLGLAKSLVNFGYNVLAVIDDKLFLIEWGKTRQEILNEAVHSLSVRHVGAHEAKISWQESKKGSIN